ncbi:MAG: O-antigen ligase family protein [Chloroflexota bacterium]|nr:O-antigen ligase family protein [Chloroflexota bacterium]
MTRSWHWAALLFFLAATASIGAASFPRFALREYRTDIVEPLVFAGLVVLVRPRPKLMLDFLLAGGMIAALVGFAQLTRGQGIHAEGVVRMVGIYRSPDNLGLYLGRMAPLAAAFALLLPAGRGQRAAYGAAAAVMLAAVALTFTRGAWLGSFVGLLVVGAFAGRRWLSVVLLAGAGSAAGASLIQAKRVRSLFDFAPGTTGFSRLELWRATAAMIRDHPIFGVGLDNFLYQYPRYVLALARNEPDLSHPHDLILDFWSRIGIFGLAALAWLEVAFFRCALELARSGDGLVRCLAVGLMGSMADALVHGLVDNSYFLPDLSLVFWLSFALVQVLAVAPKTTPRRPGRGYFL